MPLWMRELCPYLDYVSKRQMDLDWDIFLMGGRLAGHAQEGDRGLAKLAPGGCRHMGLEAVAK